MGSKVNSANGLTMTMDNDEALSMKYKETLCHAEPFATLKSKLGKHLKASHYDLANV